MAPKRKLEMTERRPFARESAFSACPACKMKVFSSLINQHLDWDCAALIRSTEQLPSSSAANTIEKLSECSQLLGRDTPEVKDFQATGQDKLYIRDEVVNFSTPRHDPVMSMHAVPFAKEADRQVDAEQDAYKLDARVEEGEEIFNTTVSNDDCAFGSDVGIQRSPSICETCPSEKHYNDIDANEKHFAIRHRSPKPFHPRDWCDANANARDQCLKMTNALDTQCETRTDISEFCIEANNTSPKRTDDFSTHAHQPLDDSSERSRSSSEATISGSKTAKFNCQLLLTKLSPPKSPKGHYVFENFISEQEENDILLFLDTDLKNPWKISTFNGLHTGKAYGLSTDLRKRCLRPAIFEMPKVLTPIIERMRVGVPILKDFWPNETNAICYNKEKGHWLKAHVDDRQLSGTIVVNLSLCGDCRMTYIRERGPRESYKVFLRRRCIQVLTGESRYSFTHSIHNDDLLDPRRVSMTLRQSVNV